MYRSLPLRLLLAACMLLVLPATSYPADSSPRTLTTPCSNDEPGYYTRYGEVSFFYRPNGGRWICYNDKVLLEARRGTNGGYYRLLTDDFSNEFLKENGTYVKKNGSKFVLRMIVKEDTGLDGDHHYWLLDFRGKEPIVAGPMGNNDVSRIYSVIWNDQSVILILDDDGGPQGGNNSEWTRNAYQYVDKVLMEENGVDATEELALIRKNNKKVDHDETIEVFDAYLYDYRKNRIIKTDIEKEKPEAKIKKKKSAK